MSCRASQGDAKKVNHWWPLPASSFCANSPHRSMGSLCGTNGMIFPSVISLSERMDNSTRNLPTQESPRDVLPGVCFKPKVNTSDQNLLNPKSVSDSFVLLAFNRDIGYRVSWQSSKIYWTDLDKT